MTATTDTPIRQYEIEVRVSDATGSHAVYSEVQSAAGSPREVAEDIQRNGIDKVYGDERVRKIDPSR